MVYGCRIHSHATVIIDLYVLFCWHTQCQLNVTSVHLCCWTDWNYHWNCWNNRISWRNESGMTASMVVTLSLLFRCPYDYCAKKKPLKNTFKKEILSKSNKIEFYHPFFDVGTSWSWRSIIYGVCVCVCVCVFASPLFVCLLKRIMCTKWNWTIKQTNLHSNYGVNKIFAISVWFSFLCEIDSGANWPKNSLHFIDSKWKLAKYSFENLSKVSLHLFEQWLFLVGICFFFSFLILNLK